jgi:putative hemolysin
VDVIVNILILIFLIVANGVFSMSEIAVVSARKARLQQLSEEGSESATEALRLAENPGRFLSTVQVGITLIGIASGAFGAATLSSELAPLLEPLPVIGGSRAQPIAYIVVVLVITYFSLIIGELVPKQLGLSNPEGVASAIAGPMSFLSRIASPIITLLDPSTELMLRILPVRASSESAVSGSEIAVLLEQGTEAGIFVEAERDMIERIFDLGDERAAGLMTPRTDVDWLELDQPFAVNREFVVNSHRSIFPVARGTLDDIRGIVRAKDILAYPPGQGPDKLEEFLRPAIFVPESMPALRLLEVFRRVEDPLVIVVDEYGGTQGIVTLHDVLEAIVGELRDSDQPEEPEVMQRPDGSWLIDGMMSIDRFEDLFDIRHLPEDEEGEYNTLGGFILARLGSIPKPGDSFDWEDLHFEVVDMDGHRIDKVLVKQLTTEEIDSRGASSDSSRSDRT